MGSSPPANPDTLRAGARKFQAAASHLQDTHDRLASRIATLAQDPSAWAGKGAQQFQSSWARFSSDTKQAIAALQKTATVLNKFADAIEQQQQSQAWGIVAGIGLGLLTVVETVADVAQGGVDVATDAATVVTADAAASAFAAVGEGFAAAEDAAVAGFDAVAESAVDVGDIAGDVTDVSTDVTDVSNDGDILNSPSSETPPNDTPFSSDDPNATGDAGGNMPPGGNDGPPAPSFNEDDPLYSNPQQYADGRANELQDALPPGSQGRVTMGTGVVEDSNGIRQVIVGTSENGGYLRPAVRAILNPDETVAPGILHAEQNIVQYAADNGLKVIAVGAGRPICQICEEAILEAGGPEAIASLTRSGFVPFWMWLL